MSLTRRDLCLAGLGALLPLGCREKEPVPLPSRLTSLAFGSCNKQDQLQGHWRKILEQKPQGWLWLGDSIYADDAAPKLREAQYLKLTSHKDYQALTEQCFILGTWDDHDYASNDAGGEFSDKATSQKLYLDFIGERANSPRRRQEGIYSSYQIGEEVGSVQMILLDFRSFKAKPERSADPLGSAQWAWLARELRKPGPTLKILASSVQVLTPFLGKENWSSFPEAKARLLALIDESPCPVFLLSGDRHAAELSRLQLASGRVLWEATSSGLTHCTDAGNLNLWREGEQIVANNFGLMHLRWSETLRPTLNGIDIEIYDPQSATLLSCATCTLG